VVACSIGLFHDNINSCIALGIHEGIGLNRLVPVLAAISVAALFGIRYFLNPTYYTAYFLNMSRPFLAGELLGTFFIALFVWWIIGKIFEKPKTTAKTEQEVATKN
jgi:hypothetical protein